VAALTASASADRGTTPRAVRRVPPPGHCVAEHARHAADFARAAARQHQQDRRITEPAARFFRVRASAATFSPSGWPTKVHGARPRDPSRRAGCAESRRTFRSSIMSARRSGRGVRGARAMRGYIITCWLLPFEPAGDEALGRAAVHLRRPSARRKSRSASPNAEEARRRSVIRRSCWCCRAAAERNPPHGGRVRRRSGAGGGTRRTRSRWSAAIPRLADAVRAATASWRFPAAVTSADEKDAAFRTARRLEQIGHLDPRAGGRRRAMGLPIRSRCSRRYRPAFIRVKSYILANLCWTRMSCRNSCNISARRRPSPRLVPLMADTPERARQIAAFARLTQLWRLARLFRVTALRRDP